MGYRGTNIERKGLFICFILLFFCSLTACGNAKETKTEGILEQVESFQGYQREISPEEYELYSYFVKRETSKEMSDKEFAEKVEAYANRVNAIFYLANKWNLCEPYSYEVLKFRMEQENEIRKVKKEDGQAIYGLEQFTLEQYFQYYLGNVEADLRIYLEGQADASILEDARKYLEENKADFRIREKVEYEVTIAGNTENRMADRTELNVLQNADPGLADFLQEGMEGEYYSDFQAEGTREVVIEKIYEKEADLKKDKETIVAVYINKKLYPQLIQKIAENNPVLIRLEID